MTLEIIKTKESDGDWLKVRLNGETKHCISITQRGEEDAMKRANEIFDFMAENNFKHEVIKSLNTLDA